MKTPAERLIALIEERGWKGRIVPIARLADLTEVISSLRDQGLIDEVIHENTLGFLSFDPPADLPGARSIIIVAVPTPQMRVGFHWQGERVPVVVPPTYVSYRQRAKSVQAVLADWLLEGGYRLATTRLPFKTLAVRSGLACYGRNNITYVPGMGSFFQLVAAFSDLPCDGDPWREPRALEQCELCTTCFLRCPTGAIAGDRFLLHAERCLTYHNEADSDFPDWIDPSWHHCLIGCMRCQATCPENKAVRDWFEDRVDFSDEETACFLQREPFDRLPKETVAKLESLEINEDYPNLCRNLSMIIGRDRK